jgi:hypothetical protein
MDVYPPAVFGSRKSVTSRPVILTCGVVPRKAMVNSSSGTAISNSNFLFTC